MADLKKKLEQVKALEQKRNELIKAEKDHESRFCLCEKAISGCIENRNFKERDKLLQYRKESEEELNRIQKELASLEKSDYEGLIKEWGSSSIGYSRSFGNKIEEYKQARKQLADQFMELIFMQREMLEAREEILKIIPDEMKNKVCMPKTLDVPVPSDMVRLNGCLTSVDLAYFVVSKDISHSSIDGASRIMIHKESVSEDYLRFGSSIAYRYL